MKNDDIETNLRIREALIPLFILILAVMSFFSSSAQSISLGAKGGYSSATAWGDDLPDHIASRTGIIAGGFVKFNSTGMFAVQPELLFHGKGGSWHPLSEADYRLSVNYLELPVLFKFQLPLMDMFYPNLYAGPYAAFAMSSTEQGKFFFFPEPEKEPNINDFDYGAVVGGGMDMMLNRFLLGLDIRYGWGFLNIYDEPRTEDEPDIKNRAFNIMLSFGLTF